MSAIKFPFLVRRIFLRSTNVIPIILKTSLIRIHEKIKIIHSKIYESKNFREKNIGKHIITTNPGQNPKNLMEAVKIPKL